MGSPDGNWLPWLAKELENLGHQTARPVLPTPKGQNPESWVKVIQKTVMEIGGPDQETVFVAHSMSPLAVCQYLETLESPVKAAFFISGFAGQRADDEEPYKSLNAPFFKRSLDWEKIKRNCSKILCFAGDNDPYVPQEILQRFAKLCGTKNLIIVPNGGHLNTEAGYTTFALLLKTIRKELRL